MAHSGSPVMAWAMSFISSARTAARAHKKSCSEVVTSVPFLMRPRSKPDAFGLALKGTRGGAWAHQKGESVGAEHALSFAFRERVHQWVHTSILPKGPALDLIELQREFSLFRRVDGPAIVPPEIMRLAKTYRQAVRLCLLLARHRRPGLTLSDIAIECDLTRQHVTDYFHEDDRPQRKNLPAEDVRTVEAFLGNSAISQWHAMGARFTVLEVLQAREAA